MRDVLEVLQKVVVVIIVLIYSWPTRLKSFALVHRSIEMHFVCSTCTPIASALLTLQEFRLYSTAAKWKLDQHLLRLLPNWLPIELPGGEYLPRYRYQLAIIKTRRKRCRLDLFVGHRTLFLRVEANQSSSFSIPLRFPSSRWRSFVRA